MPGIGRDGDERTAQIQLGVGQAAVLSPRDDRDWTSDARRARASARLAGPQHLPLRGALPAGQNRGEDAVGDRLLERVQDLDPGDEVGGVVGDAFDAVGIEDFRVDQPHALDTEVLRDPDCAGDVDDVLRIDEDEEGGGGRTADGRSRSVPPLPAPSHCPLDHASPRNDTSCFLAFRAAANPAFSTAFM